MGAITARVGYNRWNGNGVAGTSNNDSKLGLGINYALSKRTAIYSDLANQTNKNFLNGLGNNNNTTFFDVGIAHSF
jgi:predicted porin